MPDTNQNTETRDNPSAPDNARFPEVQPIASEPKSGEGTQHRSKMSAEYDEALAQNTVPMGGGENEPLNQGDNNAASSIAAPGPPPSPAENALSTQSESKMAIGEELRDREFPVPPQKSGASSQRLVVDQETLRNEGPPSGEAVGTLPGDRQNMGEAPNIMDQHAMTPDFPSQR